MTSIPDAPPAAARLAGGYYNSGSVSEANPGGFSADGHFANFPAALADVGTVAAYAGAVARLAAAAAGGATEKAAAMPRVTVSTSAPSGGADGDLWLQIA